VGKEKKKIQITYSKLQSGVEVTGSCALLEIKVKDKETKLLIDCGMIQNNSKKDKLFNHNKINRNMEDISGVIVSHSHL